MSGKKTGDCEKMCNNMLNYEQSCKEWIRGCSNTIGGHAEDCKECTKIFREHIEKLMKEELIKNERGFTIL